MDTLDTPGTPRGYPSRLSQQLHSCCRIPPVATPCCRIPPVATPCCQIPPVATPCCRIPQPSQSPTKGLETGLWPRHRGHRGVTSLAGIEPVTSGFWGLRSGGLPRIPARAMLFLVPLPRVHLGGGGVQARNRHSDTETLTNMRKECTRDSGLPDRPPSLASQGGPV